MEVEQAYTLELSQKEEEDATPMALAYFRALKYVWGKNTEADAKKKLFKACKENELGHGFLKFLQSHTHLKYMIPEDSSLEDKT